jgi:hypothetical protein
LNFVAVDCLTKFRLTGLFPLPLSAGITPLGLHSPCLSLATLGCYSATPRTLNEFIPRNDLATGRATILAINEQQTPGLSTSSFTGSFFLGEDAPTTGSNYESGTASLDGAGNVNGTRDHSGPNGLGISPTNGATYAFSASSTPVGKGTVGSFIAYAVSASKIIVMNTGSDVGILTAEK